jgi:peptide/nickel transport system substrate-binding protein
MTDHRMVPQSLATSPRVTRRRFLATSAASAALVIVAACGGEEPTPQAATTTGNTGGAPSVAPAATSAASGTSQAIPAATTPAAASAANLKKGGIIKLAMIGEPPVVADAMFTTTTVTSDITRQIYEGLFTKDAKFGAKPMLVESYTLSPDGLHYEFVLRKGIKFHNGKDFTSADVIASLKRWALMTGRGQMIFARLADTGVQAKDPSTVTLDFKQPTGVLLSFLSEVEAFIMPEEVATAVGKNKITDDKIIGTGPFMFKEHQVDKVIRLVRYDGYQSRTEPPDGWSGRKVAYIDELQVLPVSDVTVASNGVTTGEYQYAPTVDNNQYSTFQNTPNVKALVLKPGGWLAVNYNKKQGIFTDKRIRQAVGLCFDCQEALIAAYGQKELTRLDPGIAAPETIWNSQAGSDVYNHKDPEAAKALLKDAGYNGQTIRWLTTKEYPYHYNTAAYIKQQMEAIGMKVQLDVYDWATVVQQRAKPEVWDMIIAGLSGATHPAQQLINDKTWPGFWDNADKDQLVAQMLMESDPQKLKQIIDQYQTLVYAEQPVTKIGDSFSLSLIRDEVQCYTNVLGWFFWNTGLSS